MTRFSGKRIPPPEDPGESSHQRRRVARVVHDERGAASVEWRDAPDNYERPVLEIVDGRESGRDDPKLRRGFEPTLSIRQEDSFDPYDRRPGDAPRARGQKKDLRKLSEWIKTVRALEERKKNGDS